MTEHSQKKPLPRQFRKAQQKNAPALALAQQKQIEHLRMQLEQARSALSWASGFLEALVRIAGAAPTLKREDLSDGETQLHIQGHPDEKGVEQSWTLQSLTPAQMLELQKQQAQIDGA